MKALAPLIGLALASALAAQSPLTTLFAANNGGGALGSLLYFNLTVNTTITVNRIDINANAVAGTSGVLRLYQHINPGQGFSGSELNKANWTLLAETSVVSAGLNQPTIGCFRDPVTLTAGASRGYIVMLAGIAAAYTNGTGLNQNYSNTELTLNAGAAQGIANFYPTGLSDGWGVNPFNPRVFNGSIHYTNGATGTPCASHHVYGAGCGGKFASAYELIELPATASAQMTGRSITFIPDAFPAVTRYSVVTNAGAIVNAAAHPPLGGFATTIVGAVALDDGEVSVPVPGGSFPYPGGTTANLVVHTNGMVSVASNLAYLDTLAVDDFGPLVPAMMAAPNAGWYSWHDYDLSATGAGQIKSFDTGSSLIITYEGVESYPTGAGNPSTLQFIFDYTTGQVSITWDTITAVGPANYAGNPHLIGFSPGGANITPSAELDVSLIAATSTVDTLTEVLPLTLASSPRPTIGATITYTVTNVSAPFSVGILFLGLADLPGLSPTGLDLGFLGAPGCALNFDLNGAFSTVVIPSPPNPLTFQLTTDNTYIGLKIFGQAAWLDGAANAFGFTTSNATYQLCEVN